MLLISENLINIQRDVLLKGGFNVKNIIVILFLFLIILNGCKKNYESKTDTKFLSDIQVTACNTADSAKTCDTRLAELGIILKEDCCQALKKCC